MGKSIARGNPTDPVRSQAIRRTLLIGSGVSIVALGVSGTGTATTLAGAASTSSPATHSHSTGVAQTIDTGETGDPLTQFQADLLQQFPTNYGGIYQNPDGTYSIVVVGSNPTFEKTAQQLFSEVPAKFGVSVPAATLKLKFVDGVRTLASLYAIQDQVKAVIASEMQSGSALSIIGVGVDQERGQVVISVLGAPTGGTSASATIAEQYGSAVRTQVMTSIPTTEACRTDDAPPWNAGDQIINLAETMGCTLGFGVHNASTGQKFSLTAGHCGTDVWYNTTVANPTKNTSNKVGSTYPGSLSVPANGGTGLDLQLIADGSSPMMWNGPIGTTTRLTISGYANPVDGATVCTEGSFSGKQCGTVSRAGSTIVVTDGGKRYTVEDTFTTDVTTHAGDSGGPVLYPTIFGPLAGGMILSGGSGVTGSEEIDALLYVETVAQGATVSVNTGATG